MNSWRFRGVLSLVDTSPGSDGPDFLPHFSNHTLNAQIQRLGRALAALYALGARARRALYARGGRQVKRLPAPVVSVGNLTVGGTGKTPFTAFLARELQAQGKRVAILSRGYGGRRTGVTCLSDGERLFHTPPDVGEEAYWLARSLPGVPVYTAPSRYQAGLAAWQAHRPEVFLLDDGFQHFQLHRDLDVVLLDAEAPLGNGRLLPAGPLREPASTLRWADILVLTRFDPERHQERRRKLASAFPGKVILTADISPKGLRRLPGEESLPLEFLRDLPVLAFAGLARPRVFQDTLAGLGARLTGFEAFPDHHPFTPQDLAMLLKAGKAQQARALITTSKDFARLGERWEAELPLLVLDVAASLDRPEVLRECLQPILGQGPAGQAPKAPPTALPLPREVVRRYRELRRCGRKVQDLGEVRQILLRAPNWLGDAVMALPVLNGLKSFFPAADITVLAVSRVAPLFAGHSLVSEVMVYPRDRRKWRLLWGLRGRFDLAVALPNSLESGLSLFATRTPIRLGYATDGRRPFLTLAVKGQDNLRGLHEVYYFLGVLTGLGEVAAMAPPALYVTEAEVREAREMLKAAGLESGGSWVGLAPGAAYGPAKRWPPDRFGALAQVLYRERGARLVLLGGPDDKAAAQEVERHCAAPLLNLAGETTLRQALAVLSQLKVLVTNDSGLMHAAAALSVPVVAIFGSTNPAATRPFTEKTTVIYHGLDCSPCLKRTCKIDYPCLTDITVAEVAQAARGWLE